MENLIIKLQNDAGLTREQAEKVIVSVSEYMMENNVGYGWESYFRERARNIADKTKSTFQEANKKFEDWKLDEKAEEYAHKAADTIDNLSDKTAQKVKEFRNKAADFIADKEE